MMDDELPKTHDGMRVREIVEKNGLSFDEFERKVGWNPSKRYRMFKLELWKASDLALAGQVLKFDFLAAYMPEQESPSRATATILVPVKVVLPEGMQVSGIGDIERIFHPDLHPPDD